MSLRKRCTPNDYRVTCSNSTCRKEWMVGLCIVGAADHRQLSQTGKLAGLSRFSPANRISPFHWAAPEHGLPGKWAIIMSSGPIYSVSVGKSFWAGLGIFPTLPRMTAFGD